MLTLAATHPRAWSAVRACGLRLLLVIALLPAAFGNQPAPPKLEQEVSFHIPTGSLESALIQFSRQAELQVVVAVPVSRVTVPELSGRFIASDALLRLLQGTGLVYTVVGNTVTIRTPVVTSNMK